MVDYLYKLGGIIMCGRYFLDVDFDKLQQRYHTTTSYADVKPRYNIAPTQMAPVIVHENGDHALKIFKWGLIPYWTKVNDTGKGIINARVETVHKLPSFRDSFLKRRCIVPATGYYEWSTQSSEKKPYLIRGKEENELFSLAGLWDVWHNQLGESIYTYTIITKKANSALEAYHSRMATILDSKAEKLWMDHSLKEPKELLNLIESNTDIHVVVHRVAEAVNSVRNDYPELIKPIGEDIQLTFNI